MVNIAVYGAELSALLKSMENSKCSSDMTTSSSRMNLGYFSRSISYDSAAPNRLFSTKILWKSMVTISCLDIKPLNRPKDWVPWSLFDLNSVSTIGKALWVVDSSIFTTSNTRDRIFKHLTLSFIISLAVMVLSSTLGWYGKSGIPRILIWIS